MANRRHSNKRSRSRSGCLTCRDRHMKCDEQQPVCRNCLRSKRKCVKGIRLNFTQYSIYEPPRIGVESNSQYRILDQSITIASLYHNGRNQYEPYIDYHTPDELRESDIQYQKDVYYSLLSGSSQVVVDAQENRGFEDYSQKPLVPSGQAVVGSSSQLAIANRADSSAVQNPTFVAEFYNNSIAENNDIINELMNEPVSFPSEAGHHKDLIGHTELTQSEMPEQDEKTDEGVRPLISQQVFQDFDTERFIHLIQGQKYYWLLDVFNELEVWKSIIPNYCLKLTEQNLGNESNSFLIECLLSCSEQASDDVPSLLSKQSNNWSKLQFKTLSINNSGSFERILISIVLIFLNVMSKLQSGKWSFDSRCQDILNQQTKLYDRVMSKYENISETHWSKLKSIIFISSIHSVSILKFFISKQFKNDKPEIEHSTLALHHTEPTKMYKDLNRFEISNINMLYDRFDYPQINYKLEVQQLSPNSVKSDSFLLRRVMWYLIKLDFHFTHPEHPDIDIDYDFIYNEVDIADIPLDEERLPSSFGGPAEDSQDFFFNRSERGAPTDALLGLSRKVILPNDKLIAVQLFKEFIKMMLSDGDDTIKSVSKQRINLIFNTINDSHLEPDIVKLWHANFKWVLDD
ncbi:Piso0_001252 [Millerozyma farinosa CBS 7064]|uniref:Piso0_001252 protein n=1 Tax=Pichia sorbitophila (strain ATCC MYA-4447 / BCRC 22081 / CBS 7064 / NBRC 10061 / NRRL Y-12695) TaxID=559304 RepID=G8YMN6_PICSO|nr:Piso0_001252 [Millerozyma farinosa CBS 7064]